MKEEDKENENDGNYSGLSRNCWVDKDSGKDTWSLHRDRRETKSQWRHLLETYKFSEFS